MNDDRPMSPGTYLRKRREASRYGVLQAAASLAALPWAIRPAGRTEINRLADRLNSAEADLVPLSQAQAELVANVFPFDAGVYLRLVDWHAARPFLPPAPPRICRSCACSEHDGCPQPHPFIPGHFTGCAWSAVDPTVCTACEDLLGQLMGQAA